MSGRQAVEAIRRELGLSFLAHPDNQRRPWTDWTVTDFTGLEVVNLDSVVRGECRSVGLLNICTFICVPRTFTGLLHAGTARRELARWDGLTARRRVVGIGGVDAHGTFKINRHQRVKMVDYRNIFRTVTTHVLLPQPFTGHSAADRNLVYQALRRGHAFIAFEALGSATDFLFYARCGTAVADMGDVLLLQEGQVAQLEVSVPASRPCLIRLRRQGEVVAETTGTRLTHVTSAPGVYRVEVLLFAWQLANGLFGGVKPWIFSNPVYVRPGKGISPLDPKYTTNDTQGADDDR